MVVISRQQLPGADKAVQLRRSVFVDKGAQPELRHNKSEIALSIRISDLHFACAPPGLKLSENVQYCLLSVYTQPGPDVLKL